MNDIRTFDTGATRDTDAGKLDYEGFLSPRVLTAFARYMDANRVQSDGSLRSSDNWQKGIPSDAYMKSGYRHFMEWWATHRGVGTVDAEQALCALLFNAMGYLKNLLDARAAAEDFTGPVAAITSDADPCAVYESMDDYLAKTHPTGIAFSSLDDLKANLPAEAAKYTPHAPLTGYGLQTNGIGGMAGLCGQLTGGALYVQGNLTGGYNPYTDTSNVYRPELTACGFPTGNVEPVPAAQPAPQKSLFEKVFGGLTGSV